MDDDAPMAELTRRLDFDTMIRALQQRGFRVCQRASNAWCHLRVDRHAHAEDLHLEHKPDGRFHIRHVFGRSPIVQIYVISAWDEWLSFVSHILGGIHKMLETPRQTEGGCDDVRAAVRHYLPLQLMPSESAKSKIMSPPLLPPPGHGKPKCKGPVSEFTEMCLRRLHYPSSYPKAAELLDIYHGQNDTLRALLRAAGEYSVPPLRKWHHVALGRKPDT